MRHTPEVAFELDRGLDATERVGRLLEEAGFAPGSHEPAEEDAAAARKDEEDRE
jgi:hypothetical protein